MINGVAMSQHCATSSGQKPSAAHVTKNVQLKLPQDLSSY
jgi:hypothetical protein